MHCVNEAGQTTERQTTFEKIQRCQLLKRGLKFPRTHLLFDKFDHHVTPGSPHALMDT